MVNKKQETKVVQLNCPPAAIMTIWTHIFKVRQLFLHLYYIMFIMFTGFLIKGSSQYAHTVGWVLQSYDNKQV